MYVFAVDEVPQSETFSIISYYVDRVYNNTQQAISLNNYVHLHVHLVVTISIKYYNWFWVR